MGKAKTPEELMQDIDEVLKLTPGKKKLNLHACYAIFEDGEFVDRDQIEPKHFAKWVEFAKQRQMGIDFNPTFFPEIALHITRPVRWDSDHVVLFDDETKEMAESTLVSPLYTQRGLKKDAGCI